ncbi:MAG TPA: alpha-(1-_3)-arabinofuranosyltransferase family protein, partial [Candidatus Baltobacteraceae bacterium]|nr:alpha-(1->3)-arabinofuranosyltransferase family protein [Candidatus Baltobacteraceae bacterium]
MLLQEPQLTPPQSSLRFSRGGWASAHSAQIAIGVSLLALFAVCLHWWHPGYVIAQGDNPPLITPGIWFEKALGAWSNYNTYFGQVDGSFTFVPFMLLWWTADWLFGGSLGQIVTQYATVAAAWTGAYFFARSLRVNVPAAAAAAWLYTINPFTQIVFGPTLTMGMFFGIIAWAGVWIAKAAAFPAHRGRARLWLTLLAFAAMPVLGPTPSLVFQMALGCIVLGGCFLLIADARGEFLRWSAGTASMMIAASLWWAVPDALSFVGATIPHPTALSDLSWTYARSSLLNNLRFLYTWLWGYPEYFPAAAAYDANLLTYAAGFFPVVAAAAGLITLRGRRLTICRYALAVALIVMFVSKGTHPPFAWLNGALAAAPGAFLIYADPGGEVALALLFLSAAAALVLDRAQVSALAASFAAVALSGICLINGSIFHGTVVGSNSQLMPSQYVKVPAYWRAAADYLNGARTPGGVLLLPPHLSPGYDVQYDFGYYGIDSVATNLVSRRLLYLDAGLTAGLGYLKHPPSQELADRLRDLLAVRSPLAPLMMRDLGIRYVLYRNDVVHTQHEWFSQKEVSALLQREPMQFGPLAVYDLGPAQSSFTLSERWITGGYGRENAGDMAELAALEEPLPRVDIASVPAHFPAHPALIEQSESVIDGADDARPFGGSEPGVDRAVSFTSDAALGKIHVVVKGQSRRELRVSLARMSAPVDVADIPLSNLQPAAAQDLALLTSHPAAVEKKQGRLALRQIVHNYNPRAIWADVLVRVPAEPPRTYTLTAQNARYDAAEETAPSGILLRFRHVLIPEGRTALGLFGRPVRRARALAAATHDIRVAGVPYSFAFMSLRSTGDSQSDP